MNDEVFRANNDKVLQAFAKREFLNHWHAFSVYCMEVALAFIHFYQNEHGGDLPPGLEPGELARKDVHVNERLTRRDVEDYRDGNTISQDFQAFYNELHGDTHSRVADKQRKVDEARADLQAAQVEIARLQQELRTVSERCQQDVQREKDASRRISEAFGTETADLKARLQRLEALAGGEASKSSEILAGFQEDRRKADEVRVRFMGELDRLKALDLSRVPELSHEILRLQDMVMGSRDFQSVIDGYAERQETDRRLIAAAQKENADLKESNRKLQKELDKLSAAPARPVASAGLPEDFLAVLRSYSEHCEKSGNFDDDTFQFATKKIEKADFGTLDADMKDLFGPIFDYVKGSLFTVHIMQKCVQASQDGSGVLKGYYDQIDILRSLGSNHQVPKHFSKRHWRDFWHCVVGMGTIANYKTFMDSLQSKFGFRTEPLNPQYMFSKTPEGMYVLIMNPNSQTTDPEPSMGLADKVTRAIEVQQVAVRQLVLNTLCFSQTLLTLMGPSTKFSSSALQIQSELVLKVADIFHANPTQTKTRIAEWCQFFTHVCSTPNLLNNPTFPMWLFTSGFLIEPFMDTPRCIVSKRGDRYTRNDTTVFIREIRRWFASYIEDPAKNKDITGFETVPIS